jgi:hypothetical protein
MNSEFHYQNIPHVEIYLDRENEKCVRRTYRYENLRRTHISMISMLAILTINLCYHTV